MKEKEGATAVRGLMGDIGDVAVLGWVETAKDGSEQWSDEALAHFRDLIISRREVAVQSIEAMRDRLRSLSEQASEDTAFSFHMADAGTNAMDREKTYLQLARQQKYVKSLDRALERIRRGTYGICVQTGRPIPAERLLAVPTTTQCIEAKMASINGGAHPQRAL